jgi:branched-chain amino acid transport system permease protein
VPLVLQVLVTGLAAGAGYGLIAIGYALIYRLTGVILFALGELVGLTVLVTLVLAAGTGEVSRTNVATERYGAAVLAGLVLATASGAAVYWLAVRPFLRRESPLAWIGGGVAVAFAVRGLLEATFRRQSYVFPDVIPFNRVAHAGVLSLGSGVTVQVRTFFVIAVGLLLAWVAGHVLERTMSGRALQAIATEPVGAALVGLPVERLLGAAFGLAGALAALAAVVQAPAAPVTPDTGALLGLKGLVAAVLAGFGSPWKAFAAGLGVGVLETAVTSLHVGGLRLGPAYRDIVPLGLAVAVIAIGRLHAAAENTD